MTTQTTAVLEDSNKKETILVVDDTPTNRTLLRAILAKNDFAVEEVGDGLQCLDFCEKELPSMILLDVMMPQMDGIEVCKRLREVHSRTELPIIMVTAKTSGNDLVEGFEAGANDYVLKPIDRKILLTRMNSQLELARAAKQISAQNEIISEALSLQSALGDVLPDALAVAESGGELIYANQPLYENCSGIMVRSCEEAFSQIFAGALQEKFSELADLVSSDPEVEIDKEFEIATASLQNFRIISRPVQRNMRRELRLWLWRDMTPVRELERRVNQQVKLDTVSVFTAGVAHNFNNSLGAILGAAQVLERKSDDPERVKRCLRIIEQAVESAAGFTKKLTSISRKPFDEDSEEQVNLQQVVQDLVSKVEASTEGRLQVTYDLDDDVEVAVSRRNLEDIIENILSNAVDAIEDSGTITISVRRVRQNSYAELSIVDSGRGMDTTTTSRVFEPFFSTKNLDERNKVSIEGNGLGLWVVYNLVKSYGGEIDVQSREGIGTSITVTLPSS